MITHLGSSNSGQALYDLKNLSRFEVLDPEGLHRKYEIRLTPCFVAILMDDMPGS
jgi:hypothetical protein